MKKVLIISSFALVTLFSCNESKKENSNNETIEATETVKSETAKSDDLSAITGKNWELITLEGKKITMAKNQEQAIYFTLGSEEKTVNGFAGCNTFSGNYTLEAGGRIRFSQVGATMKVCPDVEVKESDFLKIFEEVDNYTISNDTLSLNVGRMAPLAMFKAVSVK